MKLKRVKFVIIGGVAASIHGSPRFTLDFDLCYSRDEENLENLVQSLAPYRPTLRGAPKSLPFLWAVPTLKAGLNFTLDTDLGPIDLMGEVQGIGTYQRALELSEEVKLPEYSFRILTIDALIEAKKAAGRSKDLDHLRDLEALKELKQQKSQKPKN